RAATTPTTNGCGPASSPRPAAVPTASASSAPTVRPRPFTQTFARRWPVSWQRVKGHDALIEAFDRVVRRGRLAHAYLFTGPTGVGKRLFADELAKALLCENPPRARLEACDHCDSCRQVEAATHPDVFATVRPEESQAMPIEVMREVSRNLALKPARGRGKIALVDDADSLHDPITGHAAAN